MWPPTWSPTRSPTRVPTTRPPTWEMTSNPTFRITCDTDDWKIIELTLPAAFGSQRLRQVRCYDFYIEPLLCNAMSSDPKSTPAWVLCSKQCWKRSQCPPVIMFPTAVPTIAAAPPVTVMLPTPPGPTAAPVRPTNARPVAQPTSTATIAKPQLVMPLPPPTTTRQPTLVPVPPKPVAQQLMPSVAPTMMRQPSSIMSPVVVVAPTDDDRIWIPFNNPPPNRIPDTLGATTSWQQSVALQDYKNNNPSDPRSSIEGNDVPEKGLPNVVPSSLTESAHPPTAPPRTELNRTTSSSSSSSQPHTTTLNNDTLAVDLLDDGTSQPSMAPSAIRLRNNNNNYDDISESDEVWVRSVTLKLSQVSRLQAR